MIKERRLVIALSGSSLHPHLMGTYARARPDLCRLEAGGRQSAMLSRADFETALASVRPSLSEEQVREHRAWSQARGSRPSTAA